MALLALIARRRLQQPVLETTLGPEALDARMIAVTGHAVLFQQLLMKGDAGIRPIQGLSCRQKTANLFRTMTTLATAGCRPGKRRVAGKTVCFQSLMPRNQLAGLIIR